MPISIYNYEESKIPMILEMVRHTSLKDLENKYYLDNDWQHGPNTFIVLRNESDESFLYDEIKEFVQQYITKNPISKEYLANKKKIYAERQQVLLQAESRDYEDEKEMQLYEHGEVHLRQKKSNVFNSEYHRKMFDKYRCHLNSEYVKLLEKFPDLTKKERAHLFLHQFRYIATLYEEGAATGHLTFLSHAQGFLSNIEVRGLTSNIKERFEKARRDLFQDNEIILHDDVAEIIQKWEETWATIAKEMNENFKHENYEDPRNLGLKPQLELLKERISPLNNEFHSDLLSLAETGELEEFIHSKKMLVFRDIVNLFYLSLPLFEQSVAKKQFYAYSIVKYYEAFFDGNVLYTIK